MGALSIIAEELLSHTTRSSIGKRVIEGYDIVTTSGSSSDGGIVGGILSGLGALVGFIFNGITGFINFSWTGFWGWFTSARQSTWNFNWNSTDDELDASIKSQFAGLAGQLGVAVGQTIGYTSCGIIPGAVVFCFNEALGTQILLKVSAKFFEGFVQTLSTLLTQTLALGTQILIVETFKTTRKILKSTSPLIKEYFGESFITRALDSWGLANSKPWSFAHATEELVDSVFGKEGVGKQFSTQALQQADQSCVEAGYVVANSIDSYIAAQSLAQNELPVHGNETYVEITPDRTVPDETIVLGGREELLRPLIVETLATNQQFRGRDLGTVYGQLGGEIPERRYRPEVVLKFYKKQHTDPETKKVILPLSMQISFRLMNKTIADFATNAYALKLAKEVATHFTSPAFIVNKGTKTFTYGDFANGFQFKLDVISESEAVKVIEAVLAIEGHTMNLRFLRSGGVAVEPPSPLGTTIEILGAEVVIPTGHKVGAVNFTHAYLNLGINTKPINLVDLTGKKRNVLYHPTASAS